MIIQDLDDVVQGDSYPRTFTVTREGAVFPLTGGTVKFTVKNKTDSSNTDDDAIFQLSWIDGGAASGIEVDDPTTGVVDIEISWVQTDMLRSGMRYKYDMQVEVGPRRFTPVKGDLIVISDVTRE